MAASYPGSVKTFTTKNAGDTIQPAHINELQDEVNAIEAGLLNGTAPLNSSLSTVRQLHVIDSPLAGGVKRPFLGESSAAAGAGVPVDVRNTSSNGWSGFRIMNDVSSAANLELLHTGTLYSSVSPYPVSGAAMVAKSSGGLAIAATKAGATVRIFAGSASSVVMSVASTGVDITGSLNVNGSPLVGTPSHVRAFSTSTVNAATTSSGTRVALSAKEVDVGTEFDTATYTFTPASSGRYLLTGQAMSTTTGAFAYLSAQLYVNDSKVAEGRAGASIPASVSAIVNLSTGAGAVQLRVQTDASTGTVSTIATLTFLDIIKL